MFAGAVPIGFHGPEKPERGAFLARVAIPGEVTVTAPLPPVPAAAETAGAVGAVGAAGAAGAARAVEPALAPGAPGSTATA